MQYEAYGTRRYDIQQQEYKKIGILSYFVYLLTVIYSVQQQQCIFQSNIKRISRILSLVGGTSLESRHMYRSNANDYHMIPPCDAEN